MAYTNMRLSDTYVFYNQKYRKNNNNTSKRDGGGVTATGVWPPPPPTLKSGSIVLFTQLHKYGGTLLGYGTK